MTLLAFIIVLGIVVLVHEWGHFAAARWAGVRVEVFSVGFGPALAKIERGGVVYKIGAISLGGYVRMAGEDPSSDERMAADAYQAAPPAKRAVIALAGPAMNIVLAFVLAPIMYMVGVPEPVSWSQPPVVGWVEAPAGIQLDVRVGERIEAVGGRKLNTWKDAAEVLAMVAGTTEIVLRSDAGVRRITVTTTAPGQLNEWLLPPMPPIADRVMPDSPAARAGMQAGDVILRVGETPVMHWMAIRGAVDAAAGAPVTVMVERAGAVTTLTVTPELDEASGRYLLGIARRELEETKRYGLGGAIVAGTQRVMSMFGLTFRVVAGLFSGKLGLDALGGPVLIAQGAGEAARAGIGALLTFLVFISVQLGILNLLPIPILDGGQLVMILLEAIRGKRMPERVEELTQWLGLGFLIFLMLYVTKNDVMRVWGDAIERLLGSASGGG